MRHRELLTDGGPTIPNSVMESLHEVEKMPGDPSSVWLKENGFVDIRESEYKRGRGVYTHEETPDIVYKIAVDSGNWENKIEVSVWFDGVHPSFSDEVPDAIKQHLAPVLDSDISSGDDKWLAMGFADMDSIKPDQVIEMLDDMVSHGWAITDFNAGNAGILGGEPVFIDYGQLKPKRFMANEWRDKIDRSRI